MPHYAIVDRMEFEDDMLVDFTIRFECDEPEGTPCRMECQECQRCDESWWPEQLPDGSWTCKPPYGAQHDPERVDYCNIVLTLEADEHGEHVLRSGRHEITATWDGNIFEWQYVEERESGYGNG